VWRTYSALMLVTLVPVVWLWWSAAASRTETVRVG
jgi:hypothetical protein